MADLSQLQNERASLAAKIREHAAEADKSGWSAEAEAKWAELNTAYDANKAKLDAENAKADAEAKRKERLSAIDADDRHPVAGRIGRDGGSVEDGPKNRGLFGAQGEEDRRALATQGWFIANSAGAGELLTDKHREAARACGVNLHGDLVINLAPTQAFNRFRHDRAVNVMKAGDPTTGGALVGSTLLATMERAMLDFSGVLQVAGTIRTNTGEPYIWPTIDDTSNTGTIVGESQDAGTASDPSMGQVIWHAFDFTSGILKVSRTLLADSPVNLEEEIGSLLGERLGRKQNTVYTTGAGGGIQPRGIVTAAYLGKTTAANNAIVFDELIDLEHSVDPSRRNLPGVGYMFHDSILQYLRKLKDGNGNYLWQSGANTGAPDRINNRPYAINQAMASSIASGNKTVLFGQLSQYKVRQVAQIRIQRLVERFAEYNQDAFIAYMRADGNLLDAGDHPVRYMTH